MGQARIDPNEQLHGGDANPRFGARYRSLEILCQAAVPIEPGEGSVRRPIGDAVDQACEIRRVVVAKDVLFGAAVADAGDHRGMVEGIRKHHHDYHFARQGGQGGVVGDVARSENQRRLAPVEISELALEQQVGWRKAGCRPSR